MYMVPLDKSRKILLKLEILTKKLIESEPDPLRKQNIPLILVSPNKHQKTLVKLYKELQNKLDYACSHMRNINSVNSGKT